jgi:predicted lipid-binding transport protein (Tim44 family)
VGKAVHWTTKGMLNMGLVIAVFLLALILAGLGFAIHVLWIIAVIAFVIWLIGFFVRGSERRWYRW